MVAFILEGLGTTELLVIIVVALILFGPRKLPQLSRSLGKSLGEFKRASEDFKRQWEKEVAMEEREKEALKDRALMPPEDNSILGDATERYGAVRAEAASDDSSLQDVGLQEAGLQDAGAQALTASPAVGSSPQPSEQINVEETTVSSSQRKRDWL